MPSSYVEDPAPGHGSSAPRSAFRSDAPALSLGGSWRFLLSPAAGAAPDGIERDDYDDGGWTDLQVPGHWQLAWHGAPAY
ncbi:hypothetical protein, partial [Streptomyces sp. NPDC058653]|uniref:hypothetical protein n=1 Tax=Streptomyces sp. NPDC058653 TaxID=3346576 RepID=UPI003669F982